MMKILEWKRLSVTRQRRALARPALGNSAEIMATVPTYGYARAYSGLNVLSFIRSMTVQEISPPGLRALGPAIVPMAKAEGREAHARVVTIRLGT